MTRRKPLLLAIVAVALAACDQTMPTASGPAAPEPGPAPTAPTAEPAGLRAEKLIVAIVAADHVKSKSREPARTPGSGVGPSGSLDLENPAPGLAGRNFAVAQHGERIDLTLTFPDSFEHESSSNLPFESWTYQVAHASITADLLTDGAIVTSYSTDGGSTWTFGPVNEWTYSIVYRYREPAAGSSAGTLVVVIASAIGGQQRASAEIARHLSGNRSMMIRFWMVRDT